jgi:hypothetical protein
MSLCLAGSVVRKILLEFGRLDTRREDCSQVYGLLAGVTAIGSKRAIGSGVEVVLWLFSDVIVVIVMVQGGRRLKPWPAGAGGTDRGEWRLIGSCRLKRGDV